METGWTMNTPPVFAAPGQSNQKPRLDNGGGRECFFAQQHHEGFWQMQGPGEKVRVTFCPPEAGQVG